MSMETNTSNQNYDFTIYFLSPEDQQLYQYIYSTYEHAEREFRQVIECGYYATLLASHPKYERRLDPILKPNIERLQ
jgi:hypothetical protein